MKNYQLANRFFALLIDGVSNKKAAKTLKLPDWKRYDFLGVLKKSGRIIRVNVDGKFEYQVQDKTPLSEEDYYQALKQYKKRGLKTKKPAKKKTVETLLDNPLVIERKTYPMLETGEPLSATLTITGAPGAIAETIKRLTKE